MKRKLFCVEIFSKKIKLQFKKSERRKKSGGLNTMEKTYLIVIVSSSLYFLFFILMPIEEKSGKNIFLFLSI